MNRTPRPVVDHEFYSRPASPTIEGRKIRFATIGQSFSLMTRAEVEAEIADITERLATKVRATNAIATLNQRLDILRQGLALAERNGL